MCTININNNRLFLDSIKLGNIDAKIHFFNGMIDYPIEKEIYNKRTNSLKKIEVEEKLDYIKKIYKNDQVDNNDIMIKIDTMFNIPFYAAYYNYGNLEKSDKQLIENFIINIITKEKWEKSLNIIENMNYGSIDENIIIMKKMFDLILGQLFFLSLKPIKEITNKKLPSFWDNKEYFTFHICPKEWEGMVKSMYKTYFPK